MKNYLIQPLTFIFFCFFLNVSKINAQSNNCTTATPITLTNHTGCANGTTVGAVTDNTFYGGCNPSPTTVNMVWYTYITDGPNNSFTVTPGTLTNAELVIYTGGCPSTTGFLQTCANANGSSVLSTSWGLPAGTQIWLGVASYAGTEGTFQLCITSTPPSTASGTSCSTAQNICTFSGFSLNPMPVSSSGQTPSCFGNPAQQDSWVKFTVTKSGQLKWKATPVNPGTEYDWALWDITSGCPGTEVCCNYNYAGGSSSGFGMASSGGNAACGTQGYTLSPGAEFSPPKNVTCGHTYAIQISNFDSDNNGFSIAFTGSTCEVTTSLPFTPSPTLYCGNSMIVNITNTFDGTDCSTVTWDFGDGSATVTTTGTTNPPAHTYTTPGTYAITASVAGICPETSTEYVQLLGPLATTATATNESCPGSCDGTADVTSATGGDGVYTYSWSNGSTATSLTGLCNGSYTVTVSNATCGTSVSQTVVVNSSSSTPAPTVSPIAYCQGDIASALTATGSNLLWYTVATGGVGSPTAPTPSTTTPGTTTYYVSQTIGGCEGPRASIIVTINALPVANAGADMVITCTTTQVTLDGSGSTAGDNYSWTGGTIVSGATTTAPTVSAAATYTLTVTDPISGCNATDNAVVTLNNTPPTANAGADMVLTCTTTQVTLDGSGSTAGDNYSWTGGTIVSGATTPAPTVSAAGTYTLTVTDPVTGCTATDNAVVTLNNTPPTANAGADMVLTCTTTQVTLDGSASTAGDNYSWTGGTIVSGATTTAPTVSAAATYTLTVTDPVNGCTATDNTVVNSAVGTPNVNAGPDMVLTCTTTQVTLAGSSTTGGTTFSWTGPGIVSGNTTATPIVNTAGTYTLTVTDPISGCTATDVANVTLNNTPPIANAGADMVLTCTTTQVTLDGTASSTGDNYSWTGGTIVSGATTTAPTVSAAATYTLTVTDPVNGCTATDNTNVTLNNTPPTANAGADMVLTCTTTQITLDGSASTAGDNYSWTGGTIVSGATTTAPTVSAAGTYTLTVTDPVNGCTATDNADVTLNNTPPNANAGADQTLTCTTTQITLNGSSTTGGATFNWTGGTIVSGATTPTPTVSAAATYTLTVTDPTNGCTATDNVVVNSAVGTPNVNAGPDMVLTCTTTQVTLNGSSTTSGVTYNWTGIDIVSGATTATPSVSAAGTYTLTVTNPVNGCTATDNANVTLNNTPPNINAGADEILTCATTQVTLNGSSTTGGTTYNWSGPGIVSGATTANPIVNAAGAYTITGTDPTNGCTATDNANVTVDNTLPTVNAGPDQNVCQGTLVTLSASGSGGNYTWNNGVLNNTPFVPTDTTTYTVTGTGANGCTNTDDVTVNVIPNPTVDFMGDKLSGCSPLTTKFTNNSTGNLVGCQWSFSNGNSTTGCGSVSETFVNVGCYNVTLTVSTPEGCTSSMTKTNYVCVVPNPVADFNITPNQLTTSDTHTQLTNTSTGGDSYIWNFGDASGNSTDFSPSHSFPSDNSGTYTITLYVTSAEGCMDTTSQTIKVIEDLIFYVPNTFTPDNDDFNEVFKPIFTSGFDPYNYTLYIFDRWGELLFESHNAKIGWDGTYGGKLVQDGTYVWKIIFKRKDQDKHEIHVGHVNILR